MDNETTIAELKDNVRSFVQERDWEQYHNPRDLALHLTVEAAELLDHFRYKKDKELGDVVERSREAIEDELADVMILALEFARMNDIDVSKAISRKLVKNAQKYPLGKVNGLNKKYTEY